MISLAHCKGEASPLFPPPIEEIRKVDPSAEGGFGVEQLTFSTFFSLPFEQKRNELSMSEKLTESIITIIRQALKEDIGSGDATTESIVPKDTVITGRIIAKQPGIVAGLDVARTTFEMLDSNIRFQNLVSEGDRVECGAVLATIRGSARAVLTGERTALNFLGRMSGIATSTRLFVDAVEGTGAIILDTRKTAPGLLFIDKLAVRRGGGQNHRMGLYDMILIKDNHIDLAGSITEAVRRALSSNSLLDIEVEARTLDDVYALLALDVQRIMLDNMSVEMIREAVAVCKGKAMLEASGNITLENVRQIAECGVDFISVGSLTHSAKALDVSFLVDQTTP